MLKGDKWRSILISSPMHAALQCHLDFQSPLRDSTKEELASQPDGMLCHLLDRPTTKLPQVGSWSKLKICRFPQIIRRLIAPGNRPICQVAGPYAFQPEVQGHITEPYTFQPELQGI